MKRLLTALAAICCMAIISIAALPKNGVDAVPHNAMHMVKNLPDGRGSFSLVADHIDREWTTGIDHLKGGVRVEIRTAAKNERTAMVLRADEVDYNAHTGEFSSSGTVRFTLEALKKR